MAAAASQHHTLTFHSDPSQPVALIYPPSSALDVLLWGGAAASRGVPKIQQRECHKL